ncbi:hypothetical protein V6N12_068395 [Hibiscus sabdariffa]|uniref:Uncharacterized protein n=1 Tax=Hibiscus sabdariffa TaxID=183260 RepID=A0ABR2FQ16_9ROSI
MPNEWHTPLEVPGNRLPETGSRRKLLNVRGAWQEVWMQELEGQLKRLRQNRSNIGNFKDDKGDVSAETTGPAPAEVSAGTQISAERLAVLLAYP